MDFIIANVIAKATEASESFGGVTNKKEHFGSKSAIVTIIPLVIVILSIYLGVSCDAKKGDSLFIRILKAVFIYAPFGGLHIMIYGIRALFGHKCKTPIKYNQ